MNARGEDQPNNAGIGATWGKVVVGPSAGRALGKGGWGKSGSVTQIARRPPPGYRGSRRRWWGAAKVGRELAVAARGLAGDIEDVGRRTV